MVAADGVSVRRKQWTMHIFNRCLTLTSLRKEEGIADSEALFSNPKENVMFVHKALALLVILFSDNRLIVFVLISCLHK